MSLGNNHIDPEDLFADTRMSFGDHLEDLRVHLWRAIFGFVIIMTLVFVLDVIGTALNREFFGVGRPALKFIAKPVEEQLAVFYNRRIEKVRKRLVENDPELLAIDRPTDFLKYRFDAGQMRALLLDVINDRPFTDVNDFPEPEITADDTELKAKTVGLWVSIENPLRHALAQSKATQEVGKQPVLKTLGAQEAFMVYFKVALACGLVLGSPWIFWQVWMFVAAGLYPHEKKLVHVYLPFSVMLFLAGVFICQFFVIPKALEALLWFNEWLGFEPDLRLNEWLGFAILMPLVFGISFQTPLVMYLLERIGIMNIEVYRQKRRLAWFLLAVFAAIITPSVDAISMLWLWVPLGLLYELGIVLCRFMPGPSDLDVGVPESEEPVEV